jgi:hypothetical protein
MFDARCDTSQGPVSFGLARRPLTCGWDWNISEFPAQAAAVMGPNQSSPAGSIEPSSHDWPASYIQLSRLS